MEMEGQRTLAVTQLQAWEALNDPEVLKLCIPGCDKVEPTGENRYAVGMAVKIGPVSAKFSGKITLSDVQPPESYTITFDGQGGAAGFGKGVSHVRLTPRADGSGCLLEYKVQAQVGGKIAQVGQRLIDGVAKSMAEDFFKRFDQEMQRRHPQAYAAAEADKAATAALATAAVSVSAAAVEGAPLAPGPVAAGPQSGSGAVPTWLWVVAAVVGVALVFWLLR